jgi:hypothetical protein
MLRCLENGKPWPQEKVHGDRNGKSELSDWPVVRAAHKQLKSPIPLDEVDENLRKNYQRERRQREKFSKGLLAQIETVIENFGKSDTAMFHLFKQSVTENNAERNALATVSRAIQEWLGAENDDPSDSDCATAFCELIEAASDRDDLESDKRNDQENDDNDGLERWKKILDRLYEEYQSPRRGFARLMYGETSPSSRRMIQLAFNRSNSFPRVLVAQSLVGREGLNLHKSCRIVILLHPEWNPGVVEQQIGRVDRVDSHWCHALRSSIDSSNPVDVLPRIEVRPVIFRGTYDELNWQVLRGRWDDLRAQLHGIVIPPSDTIVDSQQKLFLKEISGMAPNFSPVFGKGLE